MKSPRFNWLAPHYAWIERLTFGSRLQRCRTGLLSELSIARRVLVLGEGDGRFLAAFLAANPDAEVDVIDASSAMIARARGRVAELPGVERRVNWFVADARALAFTPGAYDLVVTNFFLDCFPRREVDCLVASIACSLSPGGRWLVGDFALPDGAIPRLAAYAALAAMYICFAVGTDIPARRLADPRPALAAHGLTPEREVRFLRGFLVSTLWRRPA